MPRFLVLPEVAGELGPHTVMDRTTHPPEVHRLHYVLTGWLGDCLVESFPCFLCTAGLSEDLDRAGFSGCRFAEAEVSISPEFAEMNAHAALPRFRWLKVPRGDNPVRDFGTDALGRLVVSSRAIECLRMHGIQHAHISPFAGSPPSRPSASP